MSEFIPEAAPRDPQPVSGWPRWWRSGEHALSVAVLALLVLVPLLEAVLRKTSSWSIAGASAFAQHFTLLISVLGGALAAREGRLLSLSSLPAFLPARWKPIVSVISSAVAMAIAVFLCVCGWQYVQSQPADQILAYGIPKRVFQIFLPLGFGAV